MKTYATYAKKPEETRYIFFGIVGVENREQAERFAAMQAAAHYGEHTEFNILTLSVKNLERDYASLSEANPHGATVKAPAETTE